MDPNAALAAILRGHMFTEHCEALRNWLLHGGFAPDPQRIPTERCHPAFVDWPAGEEVTASKWGLCCEDYRTSWAELLDPFGDAW